MKKYLVFSTLVILFFLFGCEEERALRLHIAPEYYQGRAMLPNGQQIEMTESDRAHVIESCAPEDTVQAIPKGERRWFGTVTLTRPLTETAASPVFPTATFFNVNNQPYVQCHIDTATYVKAIEAVPKSMLDYQYSVDSYPDVAKLRVAQPHERAHFLKEMKKPIGNEPYPERTGIDQTLFHITMPFEGEIELTFKSPDYEDTVIIPIQSPSRQPYLSLGLGTEKSEEETQYAIYSSTNQEDYRHALRPKDASITKLLGAKLAEQLPTTLVPGTRYPLFSFSFTKDGEPQKQLVSITYKKNKLTYGKDLSKQVNGQYVNRRHAIFHDLALIGTESRDASFLDHANAEEIEFLFAAIERSNSVSQAGTPASTPYLTLFEGVYAQTFDISYDEENVFLTNANTGSHFKLLNDDADWWHDLFDDKMK